MQLIMLWRPAHRSCCSRCSQPGVLNSISMAGRLLMFTLSTRVCSNRGEQLPAEVGRGDSCSGAHVRRQHTGCCNMQGMPQCVAPPVAAFPAHLQGIQPPCGLVLQQQAAGLLGVHCYDKLPPPLPYHHERHRLAALLVKDGAHCGGGEANSGQGQGAG